MRPQWALLATLVGVASPAGAQELPARKPGLWNVSVQMAGMPAAMGSQHCTDAKTDADLQRKAMAGGPDQKCTQKSFKRTASGFEMEAECSGSEGKATMHSVASGDFNSAYTVDNKIRFDPPRHGMREAQMKISAQHGGACPAGMLPGQVRMTGMPGMPAHLQGMTPEQIRKLGEELQKAQGKK